MKKCTWIILQYGQEVRVLYPIGYVKPFMPKLFWPFQPFKAVWMI